MLNSLHFSSSDLWPCTPKPQASKPKPTDQQPRHALPHAPAGLRKKSSDKELLNPTSMIKKWKNSESTPHYTNVTRMAFEMEFKTM